MAIANRRGHCLCGAIEYQFDEQPNWVAHCHCESCRRATSSPMTTWVSVPRTALRYTRGQLTYYQSSPGVGRGFCGTCGSPMTYEPDSLPDEVHLYAASLVDPAEAEPELHVFVDEQLPWFETADHLPRYATTRSGGADPIRYGPRE
ncbi:MAG: GFA family protein [Hyphomicrobiaceae bacterium]